MKNSANTHKQESSVYIERTFGQRFSAREKDKILTEIISDEAVFNALVDHILNNDNHFNIGPAWVLSYAGVSQPDWFLNRLEELVNSLKPSSHPAVYRAIARVLRYIPVSENQAGMVINLCMNWLADPKQSIAVKAFSMHALSKLIHIAPEICPELRFLIESMLPYASSGIKNTGQKVLHKIEKLGY